NQPGPGSPSLTSFRVPTASLEWWEARLEVAGAFPELGVDEMGRSRLLFTDPEGQSLELVDDTDLPSDSTPWTAVVAAERSIKGILGVDLDSARPDATSRVLTELLGYKPAK